MAVRDAEGFSSLVAMAKQHAAAVPAPQPQATT
jgi:hypothetical protein